MSRCRTQRGFLARHTLPCAPEVRVSIAAMPYTNQAPDSPCTIAVLTRSRTKRVEVCRRGYHSLAENVMRNGESPDDIKDQPAPYNRSSTGVQKSGMEFSAPTERAGGSQLRRTAGHYSTSYSFYLAEQQNATQLQDARNVRRPAGKGLDKGTRPGDGHSGARCHAAFEMPFTVGEAANTMPEVKAVGKHSDRGVLCRKRNRSTIS